MPAFEVGFGGAGSGGAYTPLTGGEGLGRGTEGWGLGLQGRYVQGGWSFSASTLALRDHGRTLGILQRAALAYETESGWRGALEQAPFAWGSGLNGGDLLGDGSRPLPRLSLSTPEAPLPWGHWRAEAFAGRLERDPPIPEWLPDRDARSSARSAGLDLRGPTLWGTRVRASFGPLVETSLGAVTLQGGHDDLGHSAPVAATRTESLAELRVRMPFLAQLVQARGASIYLSRSGAPDSATMTLVPARDLGGLQLVWEGWDLAFEYAGAASTTGPPAFFQPAYLAGFSTYGDPLGSAFGRESVTRTVELGMPLFLEGQGCLKVVRATAAPRAGSWFLQADVQWRTSTGRIGASVASRRDELPDASMRWGWTFCVFQAFRVF
jgi:hypothetical protein